MEEQKPLREFMFSNLKLSLVWCVKYDEMCDLENQHIN